MSLISAGSISLDSTFKSLHFSVYILEFAIKMESIEGSITKEAQTVQILEIICTINDHVFKQYVHICSFSMNYLPDKFKMFNA
jgi:hypothetical protein